MIATPTEIDLSGQIIPSDTTEITTHPMLTQQWMKDFVDELPPHRRTKVLGFITQLELKGETVSTVQRYLIAIKTLNDVGNGRPYEKITPNEIVEWQRNLPQSSENGFNLTKRLVKRFLRYCHTGTIKYTKGMELPAVCEYIHYENPKVDFYKEVLTKEEIFRLLQACEKIRDEALIHTTYEGIFRAHEILSAKIKDIKFTKWGATIKVKSKKAKKEERVVPLIDSVPILQLWLEHHPHRNDLEAPLWVSRNTNDGKPKAITKTRFGEILEYIRKRAGITKHIHPHMLRWSGATHKAEWMTLPALAKFGGWTKDSKVLLNFYIHFHQSKEVEKAVLKQAGIQTEEIEKEENILKRKECPRCQYKNPPTLKLCKHCSLPLDTEIALQQLEAEEKIPKANRVLELVQQFFIKKYPEMVKEALQQPQIQQLINEIQPKNENKVGGN